MIVIFRQPDAELQRLMKEKIIKVLPGAKVQMEEVHEVKVHWRQSLWWHLRWYQFVMWFTCKLIPSLKEDNPPIQIK